MKSEREQPISKPDSSVAGRYPAVDVVAKSALAVAILGSVILLGANIAFGHFPWAPGVSGDIVGQQEAQSRETAFAAQSALELSTVRDSDVSKVVQGMGLSQAERDNLLTQLTLPRALDSATPQQVPADPQAQAPAPHPDDRIRLAWITLWDTDAEDGDVVRIDSLGYSRTVTLRKEPITFAVPVPRNSVISVTGVRDGEGGGITVGLASGGSRAVFPIMSVGQTLGLKAQFSE